MAPISINPKCVGSESGVVQFHASGGSGSGYQFSVPILVIFKFNFHFSSYLFRSMEALTAQKLKRVHLVQELTVLLQ